MSIRPLGGGDPNYSSGEEVKKSREGNIDGHKVSQQSSHSSSEENLGQVSSSVISAEGGANVDKIVSHHFDKGKRESKKEIKHVVGPEGDIYAVVTKNSKEVDLDDVLEGVQQLFEEAENSVESKEIVQEGLKAMFTSISNDIKRCLKEIPGNLEESLEKTKEGLGKVSKNLQEGFEGISGKLKKSLEKTKEDLGKVSKNIQKGFKGSFSKEEELASVSSKILEGKQEEEKSKQGDLPSFAEEVRVDVNNEALALDDFRPDRDIYPTFSEARKSLDRFLQTSQVVLLSDGSEGRELPSFVEGGSSSSLPSAEQLQDFLGELDETVKTQGRSARVKEAVLSFLRNIKEKFLAFWQFLQKLFSRSSEASDVGVEEQDLPEESTTTSTSRTSSFVDLGRRTSEQNSLLEELKERLKVRGEENKEDWE